MNRSVRIGHEMLNHKGDHIFVTARTLQELTRRGYLGRDRVTGLKYFDPKGYELFRDGERGTPWWYELGPELNGPNVATCKCKSCKRLQLGLNDAGSDSVVAEMVVKEVVKKRRHANRAA